jgi:hypothetical protein
MDEKLFFEKIINKLYSRKYSWFHNFKVKSLQPRFRSTTLFIIGEITVDENWLSKQWREYHYSTPFPDINQEDISFADFIGGDLAENLKKDMILSYKTINPKSTIDDTTFTYVKVATTDLKLGEENLRESIRKVLKENKVKDRLEKLIDKIGFHKTCKSVGGVRNMAKVMGMDVAELLNTYFVGEKLSTDDMKDTGMGVGGYDFKFTPIYVSEKNERIIFNYAITEGKVSLIYGTGETFDLMDDKLRNKDYWWEVEYEISDLFILYSTWLLEDLNYEDKEEMLTPSVEFYFRPKI